MVNEESNLRFKDILASIQRVQKISTNNDDLRNTDLTKLREELITANKNWFEHKYTANESKAFWDRQKSLEEAFENLLKHQQRRYEDRRASKSVVYNKNVKSRVVDRVQNEHQEIKDFNKFLEETGGHCGGWKEGDHLFYLKIIAKHKLEETADIINDHLPDISKEEVLEHDQWYKKYVELKAKYKSAINDWRSKQNQQNQKKVTSLTNVENSMEIKSKNKTVRIPSESEKQKIKEWKVHQFLKKEKELEEKRVQEMLKKEKEEKRRKKQAEQRAIIDHYRKEKAECEQALAAAREAQKLQEMREIAARANQMIKQYRIEDRKFIEKMKERRHLAQKHVVLPPAKSMVEAERDPNRLLQPTHVWLCRARARRQSEQLEKQEEEEAFPSAPVTVFTVPKLKVPTWRQGLHS